MKASPHNYSHIISAYDNNRKNIHAGGVGCNTYVMCYIILFNEGYIMS